MLIPILHLPSGESLTRLLVYPFFNFFREISYSSHAFLNTWAVRGFVFVKLDHADVFTTRCKLALWITQRHGHGLTSAPGYQTPEVYQDPRRHTPNLSNPSNKNRRLLVVVREDEPIAKRQGYPVQRLG